MHTKLNKPKKTMTPQEILLLKNLGLFASLFQAKIVIDLRAVLEVNLDIDKQVKEKQFFEESIGPA